MTPRVTPTPIPAIAPLEILDDVCEFAVGVMEGCTAADTVEYIVLVI
jgi:hypothetical protein